MIDNKKNLDKFKITDRYETEECIGSGSTGVVYRSKDLENNTTVAIKILKSELTKNIKFIEILKEELKDVFKLDHKNIVKYHELVEYRDKYCLVMEYIEGSSLEDIIQTESKLSIEKSIEIIKECAEGLDYAARNNVFHKAFKPQNIIITNDNNIKITNFGFSKAISTAWLTLTGTSPTQVEYMSPEQAEGEPADHRSDLYTLGIIAYQILTGEVPFKRDGTSILSVAMKHINKKPDYLIDKNPNIPLWLENIVLRCLEKNPSLRFQTGEEIINGINEMTQIKDLPIAKNEFHDTSNIIHNDELAEIINKKDSSLKHNQKDTLIINEIKKNAIKETNRNNIKDTEIVVSSKKTSELDDKIVTSDINNEKENTETAIFDSQLTENDKSIKTINKTLKILIIISITLTITVLSLIAYIVSKS